MFVPPKHMVWVALLSIGCRHELDREARPSQHADAGIKPVQVDGADGDDGVHEPDAGGPDLDAAAHRGFPYRWRASTPAPGTEEGYVDIELTCERDGKAVDCPMKCALDASGPGNTCGGHMRPFVAPGHHTLCVTTYAPPNDTEHARGQEEICAGFDIVPAKNPFVWVPVEPASSSTVLDVPLRCQQSPAPNGVSEPRDDCSFRCSLDHEPYDFCYGSFHDSSVVPGSHQLRIEACVDFEHKYRGVCRATTLDFDVASTAQPPATRPQVTLPPLRTRDQLGSFAALVPAYGPFAHACDNSPSDDLTPYLDAMTAYLSYSLDAPNVTLHPDAIEACRAALERSPAPCRDLPGTPEHRTADFVLPVRLPDECEALFTGAKPIGAPCLTHAECVGLCERSELWVDETSGYGACGDGTYAEEGIMCLTRGCLPGFYCAGTCKPVHKAGEACNPASWGVDCEQGYTCSTVSPRVCVRPTLKAGEMCTIPRNCISGKCDRATKRCVD